MSANMPSDLNGVGTNPSTSKGSTSISPSETKGAEMQRTAVQTKPAKPSKAEYEVGFGKPPKHAQFKPGQSGNPKGRKKGAKGMRTLAKKMLTAKVPVRSANGTKMMTRMDALLHKMVELSMKGNPRLILALVDLYEQSVPEQPISEAQPQHAPSLTGTDKATLAMLKEMLLGEGEKP